MELIKDLSKQINEIRIIDNHEHIDPLEIRRKNKTGFFDLMHYLESDLITAGMKRGILQDPKISNEEKAKIFLKYFHRTGNTIYARSFQTAMHDLYGMNDWSVEGILELNEKVKKATDDDNWYRYVLQEKSGIDLAIVLPYTTKVDFSIFRPVMFLDFIYQIRTRKDVENIERSTGILIHNFNDYLQAVEHILDKFIAEGMIAAKFGHAYWRTLKTMHPTFYDAEKSFNQVLTNFLDEPLSQEDLLPLQDYLIHYLIQCCLQKDLPIQIHTGHHETSVSGNGNIITNSRVTDLIPLFLQYPKAKFVLLHCSYPYYQEYLSILKNFPNVYGDLTWVYIISPTAAKFILHQMIEMVPANKIFGFGGDYNYVEGAYAHQKIARTILTEVLTEKVTTNLLTEYEAVEYAKRIFRENLIEFYDLKI